MQPAQTLRVFTAFSGYDSQCLALDKAGIDYELVGWSEIEPNAIRAHNALFPQWAGRNFGDITKINWFSVPDFDLFTYSSPCQDFSFAGRQAGGNENSGTRSSLLWHCYEAIAYKSPKYCLLENVPALVSKKHKPNFDAWCNRLEQLGYQNFAAILNAAKFGVPQERYRLYLLSIKSKTKIDFQFPTSDVCAMRTIEDILEPEPVPEKYYESDDRVADYLKTVPVHRIYAHAKILWQTLPSSFAPATNPATDTAVVAQWSPSTPPPSPSFETPILPSES